MHRQGPAARRPRPGALDGFKRLLGGTAKLLGSTCSTPEEKEDQWRAEGDERRNNGKQPQFTDRDFHVHLPNELEKLVYAPHVPGRWSEKSSKDNDGNPEDGHDQELREGPSREIAQKPVQNHPFVE